MRLPQDSRGKIRALLLKELQTEQFLRKFNRLKKSHPELVQFNTPQDLIEFYHQSNPLNLRLKDKLLHLLLSEYQVKPKSKGWLMSLLLLISWKQMAQTSYRFREVLERINPYDRFAPIYESYIDAFLDINIKKTKRLNLRIKDKAEYLIRKELKECNRFQGKPDLEIPAPEDLPWQYEIERMIDEWTVQSILTKEESILVINHLVYEYTFREIANKQGLKRRAIQKQFQRAIKKLKPYLQRKHFSVLG
ncbi:MAG: hypothetical protein V1709_00995 [Planctomycetota bacterium]